MTENAVAGALTHKLGPLPLWQWGVAAIGGVALAQGLKRFGGTKDAATTDEVSPSTTPSYGLPPGQGSGAIYAPDNSAPTVSPQITTNEEWAHRATSVLIARGFMPTLVDRALRKYINGRALSSSENRVVEIALRDVGVPPERIPLPPPARPPAAKPPTKNPDPGYGRGGGHEPLPHGTWKLPLEVTVDSLDAPGGGTWYLSNYGGVAAIGAAYKGSAFDLDGGTKAVHNAGVDKPFVSITRAGNGYVLHRLDGKLVHSR